MKPTYTKNRETADYVLFLTSAFSQWYPSDFTTEDGRTGKPLHFNCAEQFMMFSKAVLFGDHETADKIMKADTPKEQKELGRSVKGFDKELWDAYAPSIVYNGNYLKFTQNPHLFDVLMATAGKELVEAAHYDPIWGIGLRADDPLAEDKANWKGANWLGKALTQLRDDLVEDEFKPVLTDDNRHMFKVQDTEGQRTLYISDKDFARQVGGTASAWDCIMAFASLPMSKPDEAVIDFNIKGHGPITVNLFDFLDANEDVIAKLRVARLEKSRMPPTPKR